MHPPLPSGHSWRRPGGCPHTVLKNMDSQHFHLDLLPWNLWVGGLSDVVAFRGFVLQLLAQAGVPTEAGASASRNGRHSTRY